jgi:hypothetical protein
MNEAPQMDWVHAALEADPQTDLCGVGFRASVGERCPQCAERTGSKPGVQCWAFLQSKRKSVLRENA